MTLEEALSALDGKSELSAEDAIALRRIIYGERPDVTPAEVDALFKLNADAGSISAEWRALFIEAMVDFVVHQQHPPGYVDDAKAEWLVNSISHYRRVREDEVEMLIHVLEESDQTPAKLSNFVLDMIKVAVVRGVERDGHIAPDNIQRLRRVLFASGGEGNIAITRHEAEALFDINDALKGADQDPLWTDLFMRAVADAVLFETPWTPDAGAELKREAWEEDTSIHPFRPHLSGLVKRPSLAEAIADGFQEIIHADFNQRLMGKAEAADEALEARAEQVTADEAHWLVGRIGRDGRFDANERALIDFVRANARATDPSLQSLIAEIDAHPAAGEPAPFEVGRAFAR